MSRTYQFKDLVALSGLTANEAKHLVQATIIQPDFKGTKGTGDFRTFGFLDVFEACIAQRLYRVVPGGMPIWRVGNILDGVRMQGVIDLKASEGAGWNEYLDPQTRDPSASYFLTWVPGEASWIVNSALLAERITSTDLVLTIRLDTLLRDLEQKTGDHCTAEDRERAWQKSGRRKRPTTKLATSSQPRPTHESDSRPHSRAAKRDDR